MPVANLQSYHTVGLRVHAVPTAKGQAAFLEPAVTGWLRQQCGFEQVGHVGTNPVDVVLDLTVTRAGRGGGGMISNPNTAVMDTLLVLTDGQTKEIMGTARIHGQSSGMIVNGSKPEAEAVNIVAKTVAEILAKSGCSGPRTARVEAPPPPPTPDPTTNNGQGSAAPQPDETHRAEAEALNDAGKEKLQTADMQGALVSFQQANQVLPDPRYEFNVCLALEAQEQWDNAITACKMARGMNPEARLVVKIDHRIDLLQHHQ
jgi:hypothetical protein